MPQPSLTPRQTWLTRIRLGIIIGLVAATTLTFWSWSRSFPFFLEVTIRSAKSGFAQLYFDAGAGVNERDSSRLPLQGSGTEATYRFSLPEGTYSELRFDPTDRAGNVMTLSGTRIVDAWGHLFRVIPPLQIKPTRDIENVEISDTELTFTTAAKAIDPQLALEPGEPVLLKNFVHPSYRKLVRRFILSFLFATAIGMSLANVLISTVMPAARRWMGQTIAWSKAHPKQLVFAAAAFSVVLSCYPVVFFGKSFLSPNNHGHTFLLYDEMPTVPGYKAVATDDEKGSDLGATMWYSWPASVIESRALFEDFELPLWNRYDASGLPLLGQGQSMFGDPLHFLVILTRGAAGWWDLKYLLAKLIFAVALGYCVLLLTKHVPAAVIVALSAPFIGFYSYRYSHPAFFSISYAPLIFLFWLKLIDRPSRRASVSWVALMILANWMVMNSGTVKEAYILLLAMNFAGALTLLLASEVTDKLAKFRQAFCALLIFVLLSTPIWLSFLNTLRTSWTVYDAGAVFQLQPSLFIGLFDDIFYRQFNVDENHLDPSANFFVLVAVLWLCFSRRRTDSRRLSRGLSITTLFALAFVFGVVPARLILLIPFLDRIYHIDNTFSCIAIVCLLLLAGFGVRAFWDDCQTIGFKRTWVRVVTGLAVLVAVYLGTTEAAQRSTKGFLRLGEHIPKSDFFWGYSLLLIAATVLLPWVARWAINPGRRLRRLSTLSLGLIFLLIHWRFGMHLKTPFDAYVMNPQERVDLVARSSPAVNFIKSHLLEPARTVGLGYNFFPGYGGAIGLEQIDGADPLLNRYYKELINTWGLNIPFGHAIGAVLDERVGDDLPLLNMTNARYYLGNASPTKELAPSIPNVGSFDLNVYESTGAWPRAFFVDQLESYNLESDFVSLLKAGDGKAFAAIPQLELEKQPAVRGLVADHSSPARQIVPATDYALTSNSTSFKVRASSPGVVVLTEPYVESDFQLRVNGKSADYFRVNSAFRGVFLAAPGDYNFSFTYWPRYFTASLWISGLGFSLLIFWLFVARQSITPRRLN